MKKKKIYSFFEIILIDIQNLLTMSLEFFHSFSSNYLIFLITTK